MTALVPPLRLVLPGLLALGLLALPVAPAAPVAAESPSAAVARQVAVAPARARTADAPRVGYRLRRDGTAAGAWFGSRRLDDDVVFRVDPGRAPDTRRFRGPRWVSTLTGAGPVDVTRARTRRAAWILAKYGVYRDQAQAAAVELALDALLFGGAYSVDGARTQRRLDQTPDPATVLGLADYMLATSQQLAGPYRVSVDAVGAAVGDPVGVTVTVTTRSTDQPIRKLPVQVALGARTAGGVTGDDGVARLSVMATQAGPQTYATVVRLLPTDRLLVRRPASGRGSRVVLAGQKQSRIVRRDVAVRARPQVELTGPATARLTAPLPGTVAVTGGYASTRTATVSLHGPFPVGSFRHCSPDSVASTAQLEVAGDGPYAVPTVTVPAPGVYNWSVEVPGDAYNLPASACGRVFTAKAVPSLDVASTRTAIPLRGDVRARVDVSGLPEDYADDVRVRLFGPFDSRAEVRCTDGHLARRRTVAVTAPDARGTTDPVTLQSAGVFAWQATLPAGPLSVSVVTACGASGSLVRVG
ncbi:MAG: hypothetical protein U0R80_01815 [Nocardioidaceae bacterium]